MGSGESKAAGNPGSADDQLAKDIARLYAWASVEGVPYRDFSRQRKLHHKQPLLDEDQKAEISKIEIASAHDQTVEPETPPPEPVVADVPPDQVVSAAADHSSTRTESRTTDAESIIWLAEASVTRESVPTPSSTASGWPARSEFIERDALLPQREGPPVLGIYSLAGGVGKTTLCANLGRVLCFQGERVLLVDASGSGLLPFYFGANDLHSGLRTFVSPGREQLSLQVIGTDEVTVSWLENDVKAAMTAAQRVIFDLGPASFSLAPKIFGMCTEILIPLLPDPNSILSISRIENSLDKQRSEGSAVPRPYYIFNEFDSELQRDVKLRELVSRERGDHLLPLTIRYGTEVSKAIASRMTVADHAPESEVTHDFLEIALWLQEIAPARPEGMTARRWAEQ